MSQYITHVHFYENKEKYVDANLDASDNAISDKESSSEMLTSQSQKYNKSAHLCAETDGLSSLV